MNVIDISLYVLRMFKVLFPVEAYSLYRSHLTQFPGYTITVFTEIDIKNDSLQVTTKNDHLLYREQFLNIMK